MKNISNKKRIGLFGGSFDPPHKGHRYVVDTCLSELKLDTIYLIPTYQTPLKKQSEALPENRLKMTRQVFKDLPQIEVLDIEIKKNKLSYTIDTLNELDLSGEVFLILGQDLFLEFCSWKDFQQILKKTNIVVFMREGVFLKKENCPSELSSFVQNYTKNIWYLKTNQKIIFIKSNLLYNNLSSTQIRNKIKLNLPSVEKSVPTILHKDIRSYYKYSKQCLHQHLYKDICNFLEEKGALNPQLFCFNQDPYEYILITSGLNTRHVRSLFMALKSYITKIYGIAPDYIEGENLSQWIVMDYGFLIVHIFYDYLRDHYKLEQLWEKRAKFSNKNIK